MAGLPAVLNLNVEFRVTVVHIVPGYLNQLSHLPLGFLNNGAKKLYQIVRCI